MLREFGGEWSGAGGRNPVTGSACAGKKLPITVQKSTAGALDFKGVSVSHVALHPSERAALRDRRRPTLRRAWRKAAAIALPIVAAIAVSAQAAFSLLPAASVATPSAAVAVASTKTQTPDATLAIASPGNGTTGTAELPPEPLDLPLTITPIDSGITPAQPFSMRGASAPSTARARSNA